MTAVIKTLAAVPGAASATDSESNTALHLAKTPEIVRILLEAGGSNPRRIKNNDGKTAYEVQTREIRGVIDLYVLFCGRFDIASLSAPEHATATSVVILAIAVSRLLPSASSLVCVFRVTAVPSTSILCPL